MKIPAFFIVAGFAIVQFWVLIVSYSTGNYIGHAYGILCRQRKMFPGLKPWATISVMPNGIHFKCQRHDPFCSPGIHSGEKQDPFVSSAVGTTDIIRRWNTSHSAADLSAIPTAFYF
ncbi:hypothetical protein DHB64_07175 [Antarcticibacterium sp. W02-3]|nr:hypothetical protein [Antarcticibacterium sp. W02-3]